MILTINNDSFPNKHRQTGLYIRDSLMNSEVLFRWASDFKDECKWISEILEKWIGFDLLAILFVYHEQ
jgi:hypothetical protein